LLRAIAGVEKQGDAAQEGEIGQHIGIAAASGVFAESSVAAVVIAVLDSSPVGAAQVDPVFRGAIDPELAGKIEALLLALVPGFLYQPRTADFDDDTAEGEAGGKGFSSAEAHLSLFHSPVSAGGLGKKGASAGLMRASSKREG